MNTLKIYRGIAIFNIGYAALQTLVVITLGFALFFSPERASKYVVVGVISVTALIAVTLFYYGILHLRQPSRKSALALASNTSVIIWLLLSGLFTAAKARGWVGPVYLLVPLIIAFLCHRFFLRPAALKAFPKDRNADL